MRNVSIAGILAAPVITVFPYCLMLVSNPALMILPLSLSYGMSLIVGIPSIVLIEKFKISNSFAYIAFGGIGSFVLGLIITLVYDKYGGGNLLVAGFLAAHGAICATIYYLFLKTKRRFKK